MMLAATRPTAVNLQRGIDSAAAVVADGVDAIVGAATAVLDHIDMVTRAIGERGADLLGSLVRDHDLRILTHCNAGALACVGWGAKSV